VTAVPDELPWLLLPIETKARELDAKVYLACAAAEAGFRVLIGDQNALLRRLAILPRGIYFDKSVARPKVKPFRRLHRLGYRIVAGCEEGLVYLREAYLNERIAPDALGMVDGFFAWGGHQHTDVRAMLPHLDQKIHETGNPRFDLLRPDLRELYRPEAERLRARFGDFILVNTNFGRFNHFFGKEKVLDIIRKRGSIRTAEDEIFFRNWIQFLGTVFRSFADMLPMLAEAFPERTIILRPHPSENHETWRRLASDLPNVQVISEGAAIPWLLSAAAVIHNSCTTGLEAALLDRPVFAYRSVRSEIYDSFLPNRVSVNAESVEQLIASIGRALHGDYVAPLQHDANARADLARYVVSAEDVTATTRIVDRLRDIAKQQKPSEMGGAASLIDHAEQLARGLARTVLAPMRPTSSYARQKFPGLSSAEVRNLMDRYRDLSGRFGSLQIDQRHPAIFSIIARNAA
jgi:surface carbohydrate biosynthesis protein